MNFTRVSKLNPCPICKKPDWCRVFADGWAECMRVRSDRPAKSGGWMWRLRGESTPHTPWPLSLLPDRGGEGGRKPPTINTTQLHRDWLAATTPAALAALAHELGVGANASRTVSGLVDHQATANPNVSASPVPATGATAVIVRAQTRRQRHCDAYQADRKRQFSLSPQTRRLSHT